MKIKDLFKRQDKILAVQTARDASLAPSIGNIVPLYHHNCHLYKSIRHSIPIIDASIDKIVRLLGEFQIIAEDKALQKQINFFAENIKVGTCSFGLQQFLWAYLNDLLTYGSAVGEMILTSDSSDIFALYNTPLENIEIIKGKDPFHFTIARADNLSHIPVKYPELVLFSALHPDSGEIYGNSILKSLPFVSEVLMKIYNSVGNNFDRIANLRFAVTYKPSGSSSDRAYAKDIAQNIAKEWSSAMSSSISGKITDFVAVGDVDIKVIGADNQMIETDVPVRQMLEQIIAKLGIPPFLLGLSWSTTERMSKQQADILTSELESYRNLLTSVILKICRMFAALHGSAGDFTIDWKTISLQDEIEIAKAKLLAAQADKLGASYEN